MRRCLSRRGASVLATKGVLGQRRLQRPVPSPLGRGMGSRPGLNSEPLLTSGKLAECLVLSTSTVLDWFEAGRLPGFKLGRVARFRDCEGLDWLEAQRVGPPQRRQGVARPEPRAAGEARGSSRPLPSSRALPRRSRAQPRSFSRRPPPSTQARLGHPTLASRYDPAQRARCGGVSA